MMEKRSKTRTAEPRRNEKTRDTRYQERGDSLFLRLLASESGVSLGPKSGAEPLAEMKYADETGAKMRAFRAYWDTACGGEGAVRPIIVSPKAREYRTTTKRRALPGRKVLLLPDEANRGAKYSLLEPSEHTEIYKRLENLINEPINREISKRLNFAIVRGNYDQFSVIFNVDALSAPIVRGYLKIGEKLAAAMPKVTSAFIYHDPTRSKYYFETVAAVKGLRLKNLFGPKFLSCEVEGIRYSFGPTSFSQVNLSIAGKMLQAADDLLALSPGSRVLDLYCGYGFFSCFLARKASEVIGIDYEHSSVESAEHNIERSGVEVKSSFLARSIDPQVIAKIPPAKGKQEYVILDPPRKGCAPGVIESIARRSPEKVLHVFCGIDTIPAELESWRLCGYRPLAVQPLDMFPGTPNLEVMVLLCKKPVQEKMSYTGRKRV